MSEYNQDHLHALTAKIKHIDFGMFTTSDAGRVLTSRPLTQQQIDGLHDWRANQKLYEARDLAVLAYTDSMTREIHVPDDVYAAVRPHFDDREMVDLTATIAGYNMVSRFLEALQMHPEPDHGARKV